MQFNRISPPDELKNFVECYWTARSNNPAPVLQKIIPDGFPEIIFHFGDPYRIKLRDTWQPQGNSLLAGQITKFFFLENTGYADILGIKLKPAAVTHLFGIDMFSLKDAVIELSESGNTKLIALGHDVHLTKESDRIEVINKHLTILIQAISLNVTLEQATQLIFNHRGMISITRLCETCKMSERQLERYFRKYIGLSPKFFTRIIRFNNIFQIAQTQKLSWSEIGLESGFYDQAHFIKNFKAFTGEDPSQYFFDEPTLANFFLKKL